VVFIVSGQCLVVGILLLALGGFLLGGNIRQAIANRDAKAAESPRTVSQDGLRGAPAGSSRPGESRTGGQDQESMASADPPVGQVNQISRVRVAAISLPLGVGLLLMGAAVFGWLVTSTQPAMVAATLSGVAGLLMLILGLEHVASLLKLGSDPLGHSVAVLVVGGLLCLTLPARLGLSRQSLSDHHTIE
jgi:hypothetical protein